MNAVVKCPACGKTDTVCLMRGCDQFFGLPGEFEIRICRHCDAGWTQPFPESLSAYYPEDYYSAGIDERLPSIARAQTSWQRRALQLRGYAVAKKAGLITRILFPLYRRLRPEPLSVAFRSLPEAVPQGRLLDVGCGSGFYISELKKLGWQVDGVELSQKACENARKILGLAPFCGTLQDAPWPDETFDRIFFWESLEHMTDPAAVLKKAFRLLKPGGKIIGSVPNRDSFYAHFFEAAYLHWDLPRHLWHFSHKSLAGMIREAGLEAVSIRSMSFGADTLLLSFEMSKRHGYFAGGDRITPQFWHGRSMPLRIFNWVLKPAHALMDFSGRGIQLSFEAVKPR